PVNITSSVLEAIYTGVGQTRRALPEAPKGNMSMASEVPPRSSSAAIGFATFPRTMVKAYAEAIRSRITERIAGLPRKEGRNERLVGYRLSALALLLMTGFYLLVFSIAVALLWVHTPNLSTKSISPQNGHYLYSRRTDHPAVRAAAVMQPG